MDNKLYSNRFIELHTAFKKGLLTQKYFIDNYENIINNSDLMDNVSYLIMWLNEINYKNDVVYKIFLKSNKRHYQKSTCVSRVLIFAPSHEKIVREIFLEEYHNGTKFRFTIEDVLRDVNNVRINIFDMLNNKEKYDFSANNIFRDSNSFTLFLKLYTENKEYTIGDLYAGLPKEMQLGIRI